MWVEERVYGVKSGCVPEYFALYEAKGLIAQRRHVKLNLGYYFSEIGDLNEVVHLWAHESLDAREQARASMRQDPDFQKYWAEVRTIVTSQRTRILKPAPFFVETLNRMVDMIRP